MPRDPYRNFRFEVEIEGFVHAGFQKVSGLKHTVEVINYREGGDNDTGRKLPGQSTFDPITLERGMSNNSDFVDWMNLIFDLDNEDGQGEVEGFRKDVVIFAKNKAGTRVKQWNCVLCWPSEREAGELDATANDVLIERLVLQNEGIKETNLV